VYSVASFHSATNVLSPVVHWAIHVTFTQSNVHPENSYPSLLGSTNVIVVLSIVYDDGLFPFVHPFNSYVIVYTSLSQFAVNSLSPVLPAGILISFVGNVYPSHVHHANLYPFLSDATGNVNAHDSIV
jgi:hypothetical protein